jgi:predicted GNAT family acetyltransferase
MKVERINDANKGFFQAVENDEQAGLMTYSWAGSDKFIIDHTEVNPAFSGQGVGKLMVMDAVDFARANNIKIIPLCPFAKSVFDKEPEIRDVLS